MSRPQFSAFWTDAVGDQSGRLTGDPLGLRAWANRVSHELVPGLTNITSRVQGFGLLCAALDFAHRPAGSALGHDRSFLRVERAWVLAQTQHGRVHTDVPVWAGQRQARSLIDAPEGPLNLDVPLLGRQLPAGTWGSYRRAAAGFGLISAAGGRGTSPGGTRLTKPGRGVSRAWWTQNVRASDSRFMSLRLGTGTISANDVMGAISADLPPYATIAESLTNALNQGQPNQDVAQGLRALRDVWDQTGSLAPTTLRRYRANLTKRQQAVVAEAVAVVRLVRHVEIPYRQYLRDPHSAPRPNPDLWRDAAWRNVPTREREVGELWACLRSEPRTWLGVHRWATSLAERRATPVVVPGTAPLSFAEARPPALALVAAAGLFSQGLLGDPLDDGEMVKALRRSSAADQRDEP